MMFFKRELRFEISVFTALKSFETIVFFTPNDPPDFIAF